MPSYLSFLLKAVIRKNCKADVLPEGLWAEESPSSEAGFFPRASKLPGSIRPEQQIYPSSADRFLHVPKPAFFFIAERSDFLVFLSAACTYHFSSKKFLGHSSTK